MQTILLTGINGQVGHALKQMDALSKNPALRLVALSREQLDLTNPDAIRRVVRDVKPTLIINPAAYTAVDKAESEAELAFAVNTVAVQTLAEEAASLQAAIIHFSTDYVYDGTKRTPYVEADAVNPVSIYGKSKLAGEEAVRAVGLPHLILRTSWVYGAYGKNFLKTILRLATERDALRIVGDQFGAPTSSQSIAEGVVALINTWQTQAESQTGIYHLTNTGETSWHGFSCAIITAYNSLRQQRDWPVLKATVEHVASIATTDYPTPAARPENSRLAATKLNQTFDVYLPAWQHALQQVVQEITL